MLDSFRAAASDLLRRYQFARQAGLSFGDRRDTWGQLGYKEVGAITLQDFLDRYERGGVAGRVIDILPDGTWRGNMWLEEDEDPEVDTPFELAWEELEKRLSIRERFHQTDKLQRLSTYSILLIGTSDGDFEKELPRAKGKGDNLIYLQPYIGAGGPGMGERGQPALSSFEADATIAEYELDIKSPRFALPKTYHLRRPDVASELTGKAIHWTRVIHAAEGTLRNDTFGKPALERIFNYLEDLDKVVGGGSEAFWLRANAGLHLNVDKDMQVTATGSTELAKLREDAEEYQHQLTRMIRTRGVEVSQLGSDVADFGSPSDVLITLIAGSCGIPKRLLIGSERGELASTQDRENYRDLISGRQTNFAAPKIVRALADRLIDFGYLPKPKEYKVKWPTIEVMSETEKSQGASAWAGVNQAAGETVFTVPEIRDKWAGLKPLSKDQLKEIEEANAKKAEAEVEKAGATAKATAVLDPNKALAIDAKLKSAKPKGKPPVKGKFPRAAEAHDADDPGDEDDQLVQTLVTALEAGADDIIAQIIGLGGAGSGNFGHAGRPGEIGGSASGFPTGLTKISDAMGSNPGGVYKDASGQKWYVKNYKDIEQAYGEHLSNGIYEAAGINAPESVLGEKGAYASKWLKDIKGTIQSEGLTKETADAVLDGFAADVLLSNWDTVGLTRDNVAVHTDGSITRIDQGGTLLHRAQGALKPTAALSTLSEWDVFSSGNKEYRDVFTAAGIKNGDALGQRAIDQINGLIKVRPSGGWAEFIHDRVPRASDTWKKKVSTTLEARTTLLIAKRDELKAIRGLGGPGSGNFGHSGRPGQIGGSGDNPNKMIGKPTSAYVPMLDTGRDTRERFSDGKGNYTPEREALHNEIIEKALRGTTPVENPTSTILGGAPGVGKSTIVKAEGIGAENTVLVSVDEIRDDLPEYAPNANGKRPSQIAFTHEEASDISAKLIRRASSEKRNIVLDGTGDSTVEKLGGKVAVLRAKGHKVEATYVTTSLEVSTARAAARAEKIGRKVPPAAMASMHKAVSFIYPEAVRQGLFDKSTLFDNDLDKQPRLVASSLGTVLTVHNQELYNKFLNKSADVRRTRDY